MTIQQDVLDAFTELAAESDPPAQVVPPQALQARLEQKGHHVTDVVEAINTAIAIGALLQTQSGWLTRAGH